MGFGLSKSLFVNPVVFPLVDPVVSQLKYLVHFHVVRNLLSVMELNFVVSPLASAERQEGRDP